MTDDVLLNKTATVERCVARVREEYAGDPAILRGDLTRQDAIVLNLQRACQACIDLAMHLCRVHDLGTPQDSRSAFALLHDAGHLDASLAGQLQRMVGFRNVAVHDYQKLNLDIVQAIVEHHLEDFLAFAARVVATNGFREGA
jgi:uncharacterized protein YutE (UPF0331/DUF86 family)